MEEEKERVPLWQILFIFSDAWNEMCNVRKKKCKDWGEKRSYEIMIWENGKVREVR